MDTIGKRLEAARGRRLWTQEELSKASEVPVVTISRIENDRYRKRPYVATLRKLSDALGVQIEWLVFGDEADRQIDDTGKAAA